MFRTGFNEFIAPWKMIEMSFHRTRWIERSESLTRFLPSNRISPRTIFPLYGRSRMMERAVVVLPQPLSPARPRASPSPTSNDTPSTAWTVPACVVYSIERSSTSRRASLTPPQSGVQDFVEGVPEQVKAEHEEHNAEPGHDEPPGIVQDRGVFDRFRDDPAPAIRVGGPQSEECEDAFGQNRDGDGEDRIRENQGERVREHVAHQDPGARRPEHLRPLDEHPLFDREDLTPDDPGRHRPAGEADDEDQAREVDDADLRGDDDHQDEPRDREDHIVEAHEDFIDPAAHVPGDESDRGPNNRRDDRRGDADNERDLGPPDHLGVDVVAIVVRPERMGRTWRLQVRRRDREGAARGVGDGLRRPVRGDPGGRDRQRCEEEEDDEARHRVSAVGDLGPDLLRPFPRGPERRLGRRYRRFFRDALRRAHRQPPLRDLDWGVQPEKEEIGEEVRKDDRDAADDDDELQRRKVEMADRLDRPPADSFVVENPLHLVGAPEDERDVERDQGDHRRQAVRENMTAQDLAVAEPFRLRGQHEVLGHDVDERAPHDERDARERAEAQGERREDEMPQDVRDMGPVPRPDLGKARVRVVPIALRRKPGPPREHMRDGSVLLERELEDNPQPEDRHAVQENGAARRDQVERVSPPHGRERSDDHPDEGREDRRRPDEQQGPAQIVQQEIGNGLLPVVGDSPVERERVLEVDDELFLWRTVQAERPDVVREVPGVLWVVRREVRLRVPGHEADEDVVQTEDAEDRDRRVHDPPDHDPQDFPHLDSSHAVVPEGPPPDQRGGGGGGGLLGGGARSLSSSFAARRLRTIATATAMTMMATMPNGMP